MKTIYYYQTFIGLNKLLSHIQDIDVIIVSSIHFGNKEIYLNDNLPNNTIFDELWLETKKAAVQGCNIMIMIGGAGGAYQELFSDFKTYYPLLKKLLQEKTWITGIDLDIEEGVTLENVQMLIRKIVEDFGKDFVITMAPIAPSLQSDGSSMADINYKTLYQSNEGKYIHWFNTQCYGSFSFDTYDSIIKNNYPPEKIAIGMESSQFNQNTFHNVITTINQIKSKYPNISGIYDWEYLDAPPNKDDPSDWARIIKKL
tara:strand:- start:218 stop:988 length:771 start_codon:yes stop_codon:yes gene_type:complete